MPSTINSDNGVVSGSSGVKTTADTSGVLALQSNGSTGLTLGTDLSVTVVGAGSIQGLTVGRGAGAVATNTAVGASALAGSNSGTGENVALGYEALKVNTSGARNTAVGLYSAGANTTGSNNVAIGNGAFQTNISGGNNVAVGNSALEKNTASNNTAVGYQAGFSNTTGSANVFLGYQAGYTQTTGGAGAGANTYLGYRAGYLATGYYNTFVGIQAGENSTGTGNTFIGSTGTYASGQSMTSGNNNTIVGNFSGNNSGVDIRTGSNYVVLSDGSGTPLAYTYSGATFCLQGAGYPQTGTGITFPATQSASSDANTLDDYEEGTWTPTLAGSTVAGTQTYVWRVGTYTKIGNRVFGDFEIIINVKDATTSGALKITGLPFTAAANSGIPIGAVSAISSFTLDAGHTAVSGSILQGGTQIDLTQYGSATINSLNQSSFTNGRQFQCSFTYFV